MDPDKIKIIFNEACNLPARERSRYLSTACADDERLRAEVESLLASDSLGQDFLSIDIAPVSAMKLVDDALQSEGASAIGKLVGSYRIEKEIARGGMGTVYLASRNDKTFRKQVAIKLLRHGLENQSVVSRFEMERQILAELEHPFIARLLDGGATENGIPYYVMEYVEGAPVDRYCETNRLTTKQRLELFCKVCSAVQYAHDQSVIHRDIKPSNILVTRAIAPKLLDFGIAKILSGPVELTATASGLRAMTPEYASPEQMKGQAIAVTSDIYSLGVLLYKLVTGSFPYEFDNKAPYAIVRAVCEQEPRPPSLTIGGKGLDSDLDNIILKSLQKEPADRYSSVNQFSEDVSLYLGGLPISAHKPSVIYLGARFMKRNLTYSLTALAACLFLSLLVFAWIIYPVRADLISLNEDKIDASTLGGNGGTRDSEAYTLYLRAQHLWSLRRVEATQEAVSLYEQAIVRDPNFSLAHSGLAKSYLLLTLWGSMPPSQGFEKARSAAQRAVEIQFASPEAHLSMAMVYWLHDWNWEGADSEFRKAVELGPNYPLAPHWYGLFLAEMGRFDEAVSYETQALTKEPLSLPINGDLGRVLYYARRYPEATVQFQKALNLNPNYSGFSGELNELYEAANMTHEWAAHQATQLQGNPQLLKAFERDGVIGYWKKNFELTGHGFDYYFSPVPHSLTPEELNSAFALLEQMYRDRSPRMPQLKVSPRFDAVRSDPRFQSLLVRMNFPA